MTRRRVLLLAALAIIAGSGAFVTTWVLGQPAPPAEDAAAPVAGRWLDLAPAQADEIRQADPDFVADSGRLSAELADAQERLAESLEDPEASDEAILNRVREAMAAHNALELRVAQHVLAIRPHLTVEQQKQLMGLAASNVRQAAGRYGGGHGPGPHRSPRGGRGWQGGR